MSGVTPFMALYLIALAMSEVSWVFVSDAEL